MREIFSGIWQVASTLFGLLVFAVILWWLAKAHSHMWRLVSARYRMRRETPAVARKLETIVVIHRGALSPFEGDARYRHYAGTILAVTERGLRLSMIPPLNVMAPALFLPFDEMALERTSWALWPEPFALRMTNLPDIDIILGRDTVQWIRSRTGEPPFGGNI